MSKTICATFRDAAAAERAVGALLDHGARKEDVSVISSHDPARWQPLDPTQISELDWPIMGFNPAMGATGVPTVYTDIRSESAPLVSNDPEAPENLRPKNDNTGPDYQNPGPDIAEETEGIAKRGITTTTVADAEHGAVKGAAWGAGVGIVAGLAALMIPGIGIIYGGGALAMALIGAAGSTAAGAAAGAVAGYLVDQGVNVSSAQQYEKAVTGGGALIAVTIPTGPLSEENVDFLLRKYEAGDVVTMEKRRYLL